MKNKVLISIFILSLVVSLGGSVLAQTTSTATSTSITPQDLIGGDPGLLPTSALYFLKNWGWAIQRFFTFNSVAKTEFDLHVANVKAAEIAKLQEEQPNNAEAIAKALENYQNSVARLQERFKSLQQTSQNPNISTLLQNLADRAVKHEALFRELETKFSTSTDVQALIKENRDNLDETLKEADNKDDSGDFGQTLGNALTDASSTIYGEKAIEILSHLQQVLPEKAQEMIKHVQEKIQERIQERLQEASSSESGDNGDHQGQQLLEQKMENKLNELKSCGTAPTSTTGNWECEDGAWRLQGDNQMPGSQEQIQQQEQQREQLNRAGEGN